MFDANLLSFTMPRKTPLLSFFRRFFPYAYKKKIPNDSQMRLSTKTSHLFTSPSFSRGTNKDEEKAKINKDKDPQTHMLPSAVRFSSLFPTTSHNKHNHLQKQQHSRNLSYLTSHPQP